MATIATTDLSAGRTTLGLRPGLDWPMLSYVYARWRAEKLWPVIFHDYPEMTLPEFLEWAYQPTVETVGVWQGESLVGVGWILQAKQVGSGVTAEVGAAFFKGVPLSVWHEGLSLLLRHGFEDRGFQAMYGLTPEPNRAGHALALRCGLQETGRLPLWAMWYGEPVDVVVYSAKARSLQ